MGKMASASSFSKLSYGFQLEEEGRWFGLFHTRVVVKERSCAMTIDHMNVVNAASIEMVEKLNLPMVPHPQPYLFRWGHEELTVTHQTKVPFLLGNYFCEVLCDVIPAPMISCHLLLGEPWYKEHDVVYDRKTHRYIVKRGKKCSLVPMGEERFISWRKEHLERIKEQEEEEKKKAQVAEISVVVIQSSEENIAQEVNSNPRTVLMQGGEDDTTTHNVVPHQITDIHEPKVFQFSEGNKEVESLVLITCKNDTCHFRKVYTELGTIEQKIQTGHEDTKVHQVQKLVGTIYTWTNIIFGSAKTTCSSTTWVHGSTWFHEDLVKANP